MSSTQNVTGAFWAPIMAYAPIPDVFDEVPYHYIPTEYACAIFVALFGLSTLIHLGQSVFYRLWFMIPTAVLGGSLEVLGWSARLWSSQNPILQTPFLIQITCCIIGPTPLLAANFVILGLIIEHLGSQYSRLGPKWYTIVFCICDVISLVVQGTGGGMASTATTKAGADLGGHIVLGGIVFQLFSIIMFVSCGTEFLLRYIYDRPLSSKMTEKAPGQKKPVLDRRIQLALFALGFSTLVLVIRAIYRTVELSNGWSGRVIATQLYFNVLDGAMVTLAFYTMNFLHPGFLLGFRKRVHEDVTPGDASLA